MNQRSLLITVMDAKCLRVRVGEDTLSITRIRIL